jgi:hypothetical protein
MKSMSIQIGCFMHEITKVDDVHVRVCQRMIKSVARDEFYVDYDEGYIADYRELGHMLGKAYYSLTKWMEAK